MRNRLYFKNRKFLTYSFFHKDLPVVVHKGMGRDRGRDARKTKSKKEDNILRITT
jgi:hypothetical protein